MRILAVVAALLLFPAGALAGDSPTFHPFATLSVGMGLAQDNAAVTVVPVGGLSLATVDLKGVAAIGALFGVNAGLDLRYGGLFAGVKAGYQRSWLQQSLDASIPLLGVNFHAEGSLDESILALARLGWTLSTVPVYLTGGWVWSWASSRVSLNGSPSLADTVTQNGPAVGIGAQPSITDSWFLELEYLVVFYQRIPLPTLAGALADVQVRSLNAAFTISGGYRF